AGLGDSRDDRVVVLDVRGLALHCRVGEGGGPVGHCCRPLDRSGRWGRDSLYRASSVASPVEVRHSPGAAGVRSTVRLPRSTPIAVEPSGSSGTVTARESWPIGTVIHPSSVNSAV